MSTSAPLTILYADDVISNRKLMQIALRGQDCRLVEATDGAMAVEVAVREQPDLIFMDVNMEGMNGLEAAARLKALPEFARTPIVALTSNTLPGDRESCLAAGCDGYLAKPILRHELLKAITRFTGSTHKDGAPGEADRSEDHRGSAPLHPTSAP